MSLRTGKVARAGTRTGTRIKREVKGGEILGNYEVIIKVGLKTRQGGATPTCKQQSQPPDVPARPLYHTEDQSSRTGSEGRYREGGRRRGEEATHMENGGDSGGRRKKRRQEGVGSVDVDPEDQGNRKEARKEAQGAQGLSKKRRESVSSLSRLIRGFRNNYH